MNNGRRNKRNGKSSPITFDGLQSGLQTYLAHRAPAPDNLSDAEVKAFWSEFKFQNSDPEIDLNVTVAVMRRVMQGAVKRRQKEMDRKRTKVAAQTSR